MKAERSGKKEPTRTPSVGVLPVTVIQPESVISRSCQGWGVFIVAEVNRPESEATKRRVRGATYGLFQFLDSTRSRFVSGSAPIRCGTVTASSRCRPCHATRDDTFLQYVDPCQGPRSVTCPSRTCESRAAWLPVPADGEQTSPGGYGRRWQPRRETRRSPPFRRPGVLQSGHY